MEGSCVQTANEAEKAVELLLSLNQSEIDHFYDWMKIRIGKKLASQGRGIQDVNDDDIIAMFIDYTKR